MSTTAPLDQAEMKLNDKEASAGVYFSVADRQFESFLHPDDLKKNFEKSLVFNVLFQSGIVIPDIFCFISKGLADHVLNPSGKESLFEVSIATGLVKPSFRNPNAPSFSQALSLLRGGGDPNPAIQGIRTNADDMARRLEKAFAILHFESESDIRDSIRRATRGSPNLLQRVRGSPPARGYVIFLECYPAPPCHDENGQPDKHAVSLHGALSGRQTATLTE